jgi:hypothetical protein
MEEQQPAGGPDGVARMAQQDPSVNFVQIPETGRFDCGA